MAYQATVIQIFIGSPSDAKPYKDIVREVIGEWNENHSKRQMIMLAAIAWETHAIPKLEGRAQEIINRDLLAEADMLIAIFENRIGTSTGVEISGTVEEVKKHHSHGKHTIVYFSTGDVPRNDRKSDQLDQVDAFKEWVNSKGIYVEFSETGDFRRKLTRQFAQLDFQKFALRSTISVTSPAIGGVTSGGDDQASNESFPLSKWAARFLESATADEAEEDDGIFIIETMDGTRIIAGKEQFGDGEKPREIAEMRAAVRELSNIELIEDRLGTGENFRVTNAGFRRTEK